MATNSLASAAHAAGFAMAAVEDDVVEQRWSGPAADIYDQLSQEELKLTSELGSQFAGASPKVVLGDTFGRWQGSSRPLALADVQQARSGNSLFGWLPSFSWRADGR
jgi:hypothetical protein